jgi:hypothetical protein
MDAAEWNSTQLAIFRSKVYPSKKVWDQLIQQDQTQEVEDDAK